MILNSMTVEQILLTHIENIYVTMIIVELMIHRLVKLISLKRQFIRTDLFYSSASSFSPPLASSSSEKQLSNMKCKRLRITTSSMTFQICITTKSSQKPTSLKKRRLQISQQQNTLFRNQLLMNQNKQI